MEKQTSERLLERAFEKATELPVFIAGDLRLYGSLNGIPEGKISSFLDCTQKDFYKLGLCKRPDPLSPLFRSQVEKIASYTGVDAQRLAHLLRETDSAKAMQTFQAPQMSTRSAGYLVAARDKEDVSDRAGRSKRRSAKKKTKKK
ncbi:MAG: hypothetical protein ABSG23_00580 [Terriglobales bacterium]